MHRQLFVWITALGGLLLAGRAHALTDIRFERWSIGTTAIAVDTVAPLDSATLVTVSFDATATTSDVSQGFRFAIAERDPDGNDVLIRFALSPCSLLPTPGSQIAVWASCAIYCDPSGRLHARDGIEWQVNWCAYPQARVCASDGVRPAAGLPSSSEPESFELVLLDEVDQEGTFPTPEDRLHSIASGPGEFIHDFVAPDFPQSGVLGIFTDPTGVGCSDVIQPLVPFRWYVVARLEGLLRCGVTIIELGVHGLPAGLFLSITPSPHAISSIGSLFGQAAIVFQCEHDVNDSVVLYTLDGVSNVALNDVALEVDVASPPSNEDWLYPWAESCPFVQAARRRMRGSSVLINPSPGHECDETVHVEQTTWTRFKALYRD